MNDNFSSTETPDQLLGLVPAGTGAGDPITTAFVYIGSPFQDPGLQLVATAATPEPGSLVLLAAGRRRRPPPVFPTERCRVTH